MVYDAVRTMAVKSFWLAMVTIVCLFVCGLAVRIALTVYGCCATAVMLLWCAMGMISFWFVMAVLAIVFLGPC